MPTYMRSIPSLPPVGSAGDPQPGPAPPGTTPGIAFELPRLPWARPSPPVTAGPAYYEPAWDRQLQAGPFCGGADVWLCGNLVNLPGPLADSAPAVCGALANLVCVVLATAALALILAVAIQALILW